MEQWATAVATVCAVEMARDSSICQLGLGFFLMSILV